MSLLLLFFLGVLRWQAEGEREHHAESEAAGHPEGLRQAVSSSASQSDDAVNGPTDQLSPSVDFSYMLHLSGETLKNKSATKITSGGILSYEM